MNLAIKPGGMIRTVEVPASKSYANRALILASLRDEDFLLRNMPEATDVTHLMAALSKIGLRLRSQEKGVVVSGSFPACEIEDVSIEVGEGGTTARFLAVLLLRGQKKYQLRLGPRLKERPWQEFIDLTVGLGAHAELKDDVLTLQGPLKDSKPIIVDCTRTTQFLTAFELVFGGERVVQGVNLTSSQSYVSMTKEMMDQFRDKSEYTIPRDWSSASYPLAFSALNGGAHFPGLKLDPLQADAKLAQLLIQHGILKESAEGIEIYPFTGEFSTEMDVSDCLDLVPTLVYFLSHIPGTHTLRGISNLVHKESDRLSESIKLLKRFDRKAQREGESIVLKGESRRLSEMRDIILPDDHRMVMAATLFLRHHGGGSVSPAEAVEKSYPNFFELFPE